MFPQCRFPKVFFKTISSLFYRLAELIFRNKGLLGDKITAFKLQQAENMNHLSIIWDFVNEFYTCSLLCSLTPLVLLLWSCNVKERICEGVLKYETGRLRASNHRKWVLVGSCWWKGQTPAVLLDRCFLGMAMSVLGFWLKFHEDIHPEVGQPNDCRSPVFSPSTHISFNLCRAISEHVLDRYLHRHSRFPDNES